MIVETDELHDEGISLVPASLMSSKDQLGLPQVIHEGVGGRSYTEEGAKGAAAGRKSQAEVREE